MEEASATIPLESLVLFQTEFVIALTKPTKSSFRQGRAFVLEADEHRNVLACRAIPFHARGKRKRGQRWRLSAEGFLQNVSTGLVMETNSTWTGSSAVVRPLSEPPKPSQRWSVKWTCSESANRKANPDMISSCCTTITSKLYPTLGLDVRWGKIVEGASVCVVPVQSRSRTHRKWWLCPIVDSNYNQDSKRITARSAVLSPGTKAVLRSSMSMRSLSQKNRASSNSSSNSRSSRQSLPSPLRERKKILASIRPYHHNEHQQGKQFRDRQNSQLEHRHRFEKLLHKRGPRRSLASDERTVLRGALILAEARRRPSIQSPKTPQDRTRSRTVAARDNEKTQKLNEIMGTSKSFRHLMVTSSPHILMNERKLDSDDDLEKKSMSSNVQMREKMTEEEEEENKEITVASLRRYRQRLGKIRNAFDLESKIATQLGSDISREWRARRRLLRRWGLDTDLNMSHVIETQENIADEILMLRQQIYLASSALIADRCEITRSLINAASFKSNSSVRSDTKSSKRLLNLHGWIVKQSRGSNLRWRWQRRWFRVSVEADDVAAARAAAVEKEAHRGWQRSASSENISDTSDMRKEEGEEDYEDNEGDLSDDHIGDSNGRLRTSSEIPVETFSNRIAAALTPISLVYYSSPSEQQLRRASSTSPPPRRREDTFTEETQPNGLFPICADTKIRALDFSLEFFEGDASSPQQHRRRSWFGGPPHPFGAELRSDEAGVRPLRLCFESKQDRNRWIEGIRFAVSLVKREESQLLESAGVVAMPPSASDVLSQSVTLRRWKARLEKLVERYEEISDELRGILNPINVAVPAPTARRDAVRSSVKLIATILSHKDAGRSKNNDVKDENVAEKLLSRVSESFCGASKVRDRAFQMFARAVTDERTPEGRLLWRWLDWLRSTSGNRNRKGNESVLPAQRYSTAKDDSTVATVTMSSMIDFTRFFEQMVGRSYGFDEAISEIAACTDGIMGAPVEALALRRLCDGAVFRLCTTWIRESPSSPLYQCMEAARAADALWQKQLVWISQLTPIEIGIDTRHIQNCSDGSPIFADAINALKKFVNSSLNGDGSSTIQVALLNAIRDIHDEAHDAAISKVGGDRKKLGNAMLTAESLFPIVVYCIIRTQAVDFHESLCLAMHLLLADDHAAAEAKYYLITVRAALSWAASLLKGCDGTKRFTVSRPSSGDYIDELMPPISRSLEEEAFSALQKFITQELQYMSTNEDEQDKILSTENDPVNDGDGEGYIAMAGLCWADALDSDLSTRHRRVPR